MNIVLIGYRGTGKTVVGKRIADRLARPFFDSDPLVEERGRMTIAQMVENQGWPFFRKLEKAVIEELSEKTSSVIATGGGAVMDEDNAARLKQTGALVLLEADPEVLLQRIFADEASAGKRPPLSDGNDYEELQTLLAERTPVYRKLAQLSVNTTDLSPDDVAARIVNNLKNLGLQTNEGWALQWKSNAEE
jgi:shikimate kinase